MSVVVNVSDTTQHCCLLMLKGVLHCVDVVQLLIDRGVMALGELVGILQVAVILAPECTHQLLEQLGAGIQPGIVLVPGQLPTSALLEVDVVGKGVYASSVQSDPEDDFP